MKEMAYYRNKANDIYKHKQKDNIQLWHLIRGY